MSSDHEHHGMLRSPGMTSLQYCPRKLDSAYVVRTALAKTLHILKDMLEQNWGRTSYESGCPSPILGTDSSWAGLPASPQYDNRFEARNHMTVAKMMCKYIFLDPDNVIRVRCKRVIRSRLEDPL